VGLTRGPPRARTILARAPPSRTLVAPSLRALSS
jgi:hypothetical protein